LEATITDATASGMVLLGQVRISCTFSSAWRLALPNQSDLTNWSKEPGHPFVAKAVERMLNVVLNRGDYYDIEREVCRTSPEIGATEVWKLRALDILTLTGPCALGLSVNGALGRGNLVQTFDTGWFHANGKDKNPDGDVLFLTVSGLFVGSGKATCPSYLNSF
jgi:hypothetical protein